MSAENRLVFGRSGDVKWVIDPDGHTFAKREVDQRSDDYSGLSFQRSSEPKPGLSITESGKLLVNLTDSDATIDASGDGSMLVFSRSGKAQAVIMYTEITIPLVTSPITVLAARGKCIDEFRLRKNAAKAKKIERDNLRDAILALDSIHYPGTFEESDPDDPYPHGGVSYWDKQDQIHQATHVHSGAGFLPWHRVLVNGFEESLRKYDPTVSMHYWDWQTDPRESDDGDGGTVNLLSEGASGFMGAANGMVGEPLTSLHNGGEQEGARVQGNFDDDFTLPPVEIRREVSSGAPGIKSDKKMLNKGQGWLSKEKSHFQKMRQSLEGEHDTIHGYIGGNIGAQHPAFEDPFVFLMHSNVDRLFASWQKKSGESWRLDPDEIYGEEDGDHHLTEDIKPWSGEADSGPSVRPWTAPENEMLLRNAFHTTVITPPEYDEFVDL